VIELVDRSEFVDVVCNLCRGDTADCTLDEEPLCLGCADDVVERLVVAELAPDLARELPTLEELARDRYWGRA
jgi:hypothetical protein